jgi:predicted dehydrogenase
MRFLIAGLGSIGRRHLRNLLALGEQEVILYRTNRSTLPGDDLAGFAVETDLRAALDHYPDAVIISNPTSMHLDVAIPAADSGCHILLEKPVSYSLERLDELRAATKRGGGQILVGFQLRFHPTLQVVARLIAEGAIGQPLSARAHWGEYLPDWHPWEDYRQGYAARADLGGGVILTLCHPLDYLRWLLGEVESLWAFASTAGNLNISVESTAEVGLRFSNGPIGSVHLDYVQQPPTHHLEIIGSEGTLRWNSGDGVASLYRATTKTWETWMLPEGFERNWLFLAEMRHFLAVARRETQPVCSLEDGIRALEIALLARSSAADGMRKFLT